jgi:hypothetical protein
VAHPGITKFAAGTTRGESAAIALRGDRKPEPNETFYVKLSGKPNYLPEYVPIARGRARITIVNDD